MSFAVARGDPYPSQLYFDGILDEILKEKGIYNSHERERVSLAQVLYHCLKKNPNVVFMINGTTGEVITNAQMLKLSVSLARTLIAKGARGKSIILVMRNHQFMVALYLAVIFAGTLPFMMDPCCTVFEINHFLNLIEPAFIFCDEQHYNDVTKSLKNFSYLETEVLISNKEEHLWTFIKGESYEIENFVIPDSDPHSTVLMLPTSGSTGLPKPALLTNIGLVAHIPVTWAYHTHFPKPTDLVMILTTCQWATFTVMVTSTIAFNIPILISPKLSTVEHVKEMLLKFRPTWTFFNPSFVKALLPVTTKDHFSSLKSLILLGAASSMALFAELKEKLPASTHLGDGYGATEAQGFVAFPDEDAPDKSNGRVLNIFHYKMLDDNGKEAGLCSNGELYVKSVCTIKGYYKNESAYEEAFIDGWYKTGDWFYIDENERLRFVERRKFSFKFRGCQVSPEEVESVIDSVCGVAESAVCCTDDGPAAAVVLREGADVTKEQIHKAVDGALSDHKRLHGGIAFVPSLPHTPTGKLLRKEARNILLNLKNNGECSDNYFKINSLRSIQSPLVIK